MEREIDETFEYNNENYKVVESNTCWKCNLYGVNKCQSMGGICEKYRRKDKKSIIYVKEDNL